MSTILKSLIGKEVQVYRKGPDSKIGTLLAAHSDYITLYVQESKSIVYYNVQHIKSVTENVKENSYFEQTDDDISCVQADNFRGLLKQLINENVHVNQGPDSRPGRLVAAIEDYIIVFTKDDGCVFFNTAHIKSITVNFETETTMEEDMELDYVTADSFHDVFRHMSHKWVCINGKGPEAVEGVLSEGTGGHYILVNNEEVLRIYPYHIKSISFGPKGSFKKKIEKLEKYNQNEENTDDNTSGNTQNKTDQQDGSKDSNSEDSSKDSGSKDSSSKDSSSKDSGSKDSSSKDSGSKDSSSKDSGSKDSGSKDSGSKDKYRDKNRYSDKYKNNSRGYARETIIESIDYYSRPKRRY